MASVAVTNMMIIAMIALTIGRRLKICEFCNFCFCIFGAEMNNISLNFLSIGTTVLMIKRTVGDGTMIQNHRDITKIKIADQSDIHIKIEIIVMMDGVTAVAAAAGDVIMITIEKRDVNHIEAAVTRPINIVIIKNLIEIICRQ